METDRKQMERLLLLIVPVMLLWTTFGASFCYELGKHGITNIDWFWIFEANLPVVIIAVSLLFYRKRKLGARKK